MVRPIIADARGPMVLRLMMEEMTRPQLPPELVIHELIEPTVHALAPQIHRFAPGLGPEQMLRVMVMTVGSLMQWVCLDQMRGRLTSSGVALPRVDWDEVIEDVATTTEQVIRWRSGDGAEPGGNERPDALQATARRALEQGNEP